MFQKVRNVCELFQSTRIGIKKIKIQRFIQGLFLSSGTSEGETATEFLWQGNSERSLPLSFILLICHSLFLLGQEPILLPKCYVTAFIVSTGTMDNFHRVNGAKCHTLTSESRRILKSVDLNKGCSISCVTYLWEMVWQRRNNVQLRANRTGVSALPIWRPLKRNSLFILVISIFYSHDLHRMAIFKHRKFFLSFIVPCFIPEVL